MSPTVRLRALKCAIGAACLAAIAVVGFQMIFATYMLYDDEGYVLISLKNFSEHGGLYDKVYSQYGPLFYVGYDLLHRLIGFAWSSAAGRWITLVNWVGAAAGCALVVARARAPLAAALFVLSGVFSFLWIMINEPMHPGGTIAIVLALVAWLGVEAQRARRPVVFALVAAVASAAALLVKVNVGVCLTLAGGLVVIAGIPGRGGRSLFLALATVAGLFPFLLMEPLLAEPWVQEYALLAALSIGSVAVTIRRNHDPVDAAGSWPALGAGILAGAAVVAITAVWVLARGTSAAGLMDGVLLGPLRHPMVYSASIEWQPGALLVGVAALVLTVLATRQDGNPRWIRLVAAVRLLVTAAFPLILLFAFAVRQAEIILSYGVPLAGLFALPLATPDENPADRRSGQWLAALLVFQSLHAYPVAGSQMFWGAFLWYPLMALGAWNALKFFRMGLPRRSSFALAASAGALALGVAGLMFAEMAENAQLRRRGSEPLALPGAEHLVAATATASTLQVLTTNAVVHGDLLFSLPGMFSLNLWSGVPTPTLANVTHWFSLLTPEEQTAIVDRLAASPNSVFIVQHNILATLMKMGFHPRGPLMDYLYGSFQRVFAIEGFSFWVHKGRSVAPLSTGLMQPGGQAPEGAQQLDLILASSPRAVARIELWEIVNGRWLALRLDGTNCRAEQTALRLDGSTAGPTHPADWPLGVQGVTRISLHFAPPRPLPPDENLLAILRDPGGQRVGAARVLPHRAFSAPALAP